MNALLSPHRRFIWVAWLVAALLFLAVGNGLIYGLIDSLDRRSARASCAGIVDECWPAC